MANPESVSVRELAKVHLIFPSWTKLRTLIRNKKEGKKLQPL